MRLESSPLAKQLSKSNRTTQEVENEKRIVDEVLEQVRRLDEVELNRLVINDPRYQELLKKGGFL